jgi:isoleucyl-tRNA synthetase
MDDPAFPVRQKALEQTEGAIRFIPKWGTNRLQGMLSNAPDWCLSRQRIWGVPFPVFYCEDCGDTLIKSEIMLRIADAMEKSNQGIEAYHNTPVEEFTQGATCAKCGSQKFKRGRDILDVWFDSGVCHSAVQKKREGLAFPADIYLEGSDQHRGWFQTSLLSAIASEGRPPFKALITHGFVNDAKGHKMSKSVGNVIDPADVIKKSGAEILRLWVAYEDYGQDVTIGNEMFDRITETYRRFRNTIRFLLGNLQDFDPGKDRVAFAQMRPLDQWALGRLQELIDSVTAAYENYDFYKVYHALNHFFTVELSATYLDIIKDRLYTWKRNGVPRRSAQTVVYELLTNLSLLMTPILTFLAEETFENIPGQAGESALLCEFPKGSKDWVNARLAQEFTELLQVRSEIAKKLEEIRQSGTIGASIDAQVTIKAPKATYDLLKRYEAQLPETFIVSRVQLELQDGPELVIQASKALGQKCVRCWTYSEQTGENQTYPAVCPKCVEALS